MFGCFTQSKASSNVSLQGLALQGYTSDRDCMAVAAPQQCGQRWAMRVLALRGGDNVVAHA
jgi:hypothetical protein